MVGPLDLTVVWLVGVKVCLYSCVYSLDFIVCVITVMPFCGGVVGV